MTSDEKKPTETNVPMSILVGEKNFFFFHLSRIFRDKSKMAKIPKKKLRQILAVQNRFFRYSGLFGLITPVKIDFLVF